jgi:hypothetical protein
MLSLGAGRQMSMIEGCQNLVTEVRPTTSSLRSQSPITSRSPSVAAVHFRFSRYFQREVPYENPSLSHQIMGFQMYSFSFESYDMILAFTICDD